MIFNSKLKILYLVALSVLFVGCGGNEAGTQSTLSSTASKVENAVTEIPSKAGNSNKTASAAPKKGSRDNTPNALIPLASGQSVLSCPEATIDISNSQEGYIIASYSGSCPKVKLQITGPNSITYTYNLSSSQDVFPLPAGNGSYTIGVYENISGTQYSTALAETIDVNITNEYGPFLYPNQYINFSKNSKVFGKSSELTESANSDLDAVSLIYNYVAENIAYDYDLASSVASGYLPDPDATLASKKGICLDYASLMCSMLRIQGIPTHLEVGYAGDVYHAWVSVFIKDVGWINGMIEFDGNSWQIMDPTFAANSSSSALKKFIGEGDNYTVKYVY